MAGHVSRSQDTSGTAPSVETPFRRQHVYMKTSLHRLKHPTWTFIVLSALNRVVIQAIIPANTKMLRTTHEPSSTNLTSSQEACRDRYRRGPAFAKRPRDQVSCKSSQKRCSRSASEKRTNACFVGAFLETVSTEPNHWPMYIIVWEPESTLCVRCVFQSGLLAPHGGIPSIY